MITCYLKSYWNDLKIFLTPQTHVLTLYWSFYLRLALYFIQILHWQFQHKQNKQTIRGGFITHKKKILSWNQMTHGHWFALPPPKNMKIKKTTKGVNCMRILYNNKIRLLWLWFYWLRSLSYISSYSFFLSQWKIKYGTSYRMQQAYPKGPDPNWNTESISLDGNKNVQSEISKKKILISKDSVESLQRSSQKDIEFWIGIISPLYMGLYWYGCFNFRYENLDNFHLIILVFIYDNWDSRRENFLFHFLYCDRQQFKSKNG